MEDVHRTFSKKLECEGDETLVKHLKKFVTTYMKLVSIRNKVPPSTRRFMSSYFRKIALKIFSEIIVA